MAKKSGWFGVKTLYRVEPEGRPVATDRFYSSSMTMVEERVIVVRAVNATEAVRIGKREASEYARGSHRNPYGQRVRVRVMRYIDVYDINAPLVDRAEVFSSTEVISRTISDRYVMQRQIGRPESERTRRSRRNILDLVFEGKLPGVKPTRRELALRRKFDASLARLGDA